MLILNSSLLPGGGEKREEKGRGNQTAELPTKSSNLFMLAEEKGGEGERKKTIPADIGLVRDALAGGSPEEERKGEERKGGRPPRSNGFPFCSLATFFGRRGRRGRGKEPEYWPNIFTPMKNGFLTPPLFATVGKREGGKGGRGDACEDSPIPGFLISAFCFSNSCNLISKGGEKRRGGESGQRGNLHCNYCDALLSPINLTASGRGGGREERGATRGPWRFSGIRASFSLTTSTCRLSS